MENIEDSCCLGPGDHDSLHHSQWLQVTLSDMNKRMNAMRTLLEEGTSSEGIKSHYKRKLELIQMLEEFDRSYRFLAEKYDRLSYKFHDVTNSGPRPSSSTVDNNDHNLLRSSDPPNSEVFDSHPASVVEDPEIECDSSNFDIEYLDKLADELRLTEECKKKLKMKSEVQEYQTDKNKKDTALGQLDNICMKTNYNGLVQATARKFSEGSYEQEDTWCELKFRITELMEENLQQQAELAKRNIEKRLVIDKLQLQLQHLQAENRALQRCISCLKVSEKHNPRQLRGILSGKFFGGGCS